MLVQTLSIKSSEWEVMTRMWLYMERYASSQTSPDDSLEIEMVRRLVEEEVGLDEERAGEGDTHPPTSRHVLGELLHHLLRETETVEDRAGLSLERAGVHLLELLVELVELDFIDIVGDRLQRGPRCAARALRAFPWPTRRCNRWR